MDKKEGKTVCKPIVSREQPCIDSSLQLRSYKLTSLSLKVLKNIDAVLQWIHTGHSASKTFAAVKGHRFPMVTDGLPA